MNNDYKVLEERLLSGEDCKIVTQPEDKFRLLRAYDKEEGIYRVDMAMPWPLSGIYNFGKYFRQIEAQVEFERIDNALQRLRSHEIRITGPAQVKLVELQDEKKKI